MWGLVTGTTENVAEEQPVGEAEEAEEQPAGEAEEAEEAEEREESTVAAEEEPRVESKEEQAVSSDWEELKDEPMNTRKETGMEAWAEPDAHKLVVTMRGPDAPGVTAAFFAVVQNSDAPVSILDIAQYVIEGSLVLSAVLKVVDNSMRLIKNLLAMSREKGLHLDFHFPSSRSRLDTDADFWEASISVVLPDMLPVGLLHAIFKYLSDIGSRIMETEQRVENKFRWNGEYTKIVLRAACPKDVPLSSLYLKLQRLCWSFNASVAVRAYDALNRPNPKSIIVFGISNVLCPYDLLNELLKEAGVDPDAIATANKEPTIEAKVAAKTLLLKGKSAVCQQRIIERLRFTPGARLLCRTLKEIGFRIMLITSTGGKAIAQAVKQELGVDYVIAPEFGIDENNMFTGQYSSDFSTINMRKADYLHLVAAKEKIDPHNVIVVGTFMSSLPKQTVHEVLNTYGLQLYFDASKQKSLTEIMYLLGFSGRDVQALRRTIAACGDDAGAESLAEQPGALAAPASGGTHYIVRVHSTDSSTAKLANFFEPLLPYEKAGEASIISMQQIKIGADDLFLGLELILGSDPQPVLKDLLFQAHHLGMEINWDVLEGSGGSASPAADGAGQMGDYVLTVVEQPELQSSSLASIFQQCSDLGVDCVRLDRLSADHLSALQISANVPSGKESKLQDSLIALSRSQEIDIAFQRDGLERWGRRLIIFDMDNTLIQQEVIDELAILAGVEEAVKELTERAMRGELDFFESLRERVSHLEGHNAARLFDAVKKGLIYTPGAQTLCSTLKHLGYKMAVISGGFLPVAREVQRSLGLDYAFANTLETEPVTGNLTGKTVGPVVTPERKKALLSMISEVEGCSLKQTIAVGDGSNDIPMLCAAGLGVAFCAKPKVQAAAEFRVNNKDLSTVLFLLGLSETAAVRLKSGRTMS